MIFISIVNTKEWQAVSNSALVTLVVLADVTVMVDDYVLDVTLSTLTSTP